MSHVIKNLGHCKKTISIAQAWGGGRNVIINTILVEAYTTKHFSAQNGIKACLDRYLIRYLFILGWWWGSS